MADPKIGIALGSGGAKGLAHILMLEALEEAGLRASCVTGSSAGAIVGGLYCSGIPAHRLREIMGELSGVPLKREESFAAQFTGDILGLVGKLDLDLGSGGLIRGDRFFHGYYRRMHARYFRDFDIPLRVVTADFWSREPVVFDEGLISPAMRATVAMPGLLPPVKHDGRILVDGGMVNPVPYDLLDDDCDITIGVNVIGRRVPEDGRELPGVGESVANGYQILMNALLREKLDRGHPTIWVEPDLVNVQVMDLHRAREIYERSEPAKESFKRKLDEALKKWPDDA